MVAMQGYDVKLVGDLKNRKPTEVETEKLDPVPGVRAPVKEMFGVAQVLSWVAGQRAEISEDLEWRSQIPELMKKLGSTVPGSSKSASLTMPSEMSPPPTPRPSNPQLAWEGIRDLVNRALEEQYEEAVQVAADLGLEEQYLQSLPLELAEFKHPAWVVERFQEQNPDFNLRLDHLWKEDPLKGLRAVLEMLLFNEDLNNR